MLDFRNLILILYYEKYNEIIKKDAKTEDEFFEDHSMEVYDQSDHEDILSEHIIGTNENYFDEDAVSAGVFDS